MLAVCASDGRADSAWSTLRDRGTCGICGRAVDAADFHLDHVIPLLRGGSDHVNNLQLAHPLCNLLKAATMPSLRVRVRHRWRMVKRGWQSGWSGGVYEEGAEALAASTSSPNPAARALPASTTTGST